MNLGYTIELNWMIPCMRGSRAGGVGRVGPDKICLRPLPGKHIFPSCRPTPIVNKFGIYGFHVLVFTHRYMKDIVLTRIF